MDEPTLETENSGQISLHPSGDAIISETGETSRKRKISNCEKKEEKTVTCSPTTLINMADTNGNEQVGNKSHTEI